MMMVRADTTRRKRETHEDLVHIDNETLPKLKTTENSLKQPLDVSRIFHHLPRGKRTFEKIFFCKRSLCEIFKDFFSRTEMRFLSFE